MFEYLFLNLWPYLYVNYLGLFGRLCYLKTDYYHFFQIKMIFQAVLAHRYGMKTCFWVSLGWKYVCVCVCFLFLFSLNYSDS